MRIDPRTQPHVGLRLGGAGCGARRWISAGEGDAAGRVLREASLPVSASSYPGPSESRWSFLSLPARPWGAHHPHLLPQGLARSGHLLTLDHVYDKARGRNEQRRGHGRGPRLSPRLLCGVTPGRRAACWTPWFWERGTLSSGPPAPRRRISLPPPPPCN